MTRPSTLGLAALCATFVACGGSSPSGPSAAVAAPAATPTPVSYSGSFGGAMTVSGGGGPVLPCTAKTTTTHTGNTLSFGDLTVSGCFNETSFGLGRGTVSGNAFTATGGYNSVGCGAVTTTWTGFFSGDGRLMNLKVILTAADQRTAGCAEAVQFLGELSR